MSETPTVYLAQFVVPAGIVAWCTRCGADVYVHEIQPGSDVCRGTMFVRTYGMLRARPCGHECSLGGEGLPLIRWQALQLPNPFLGGTAAA